MNTWSKYLYRLSLATAIGGLFFGSVHADQAEVEQLEENLAIAETTKIYGKGSLGAGFTVNNYPAKTDFSPAYIASQQKSNPNPKVIFDLGAELGLKKTVKFEEKDVDFDVAVGFSKDKTASIKKAFAEFENILLGYTFSSFVDGDVLPNMIGGLPSSAAVSKAIQLRWKQRINDNVTYVISVEESAKFDLHPQEKDKDKKEALPEKPNQDWPVAAGHVRYHYADNPGHIQLGVLGRMLDYYHTKTKETYLKPGFGVNLGTAYHITPEKTIVKANALYGQGIGSYVMDLALLEDEVNTAYVTKQSKELQTLNVWGTYLDLEHHWTKEVRFAVTGGLLSTIGSDDRPNKKAYKTGAFGALKACYHPTEQFHFGIGYLLGGRYNKSNKMATANRIQFESVFKF